MTRRSPGVCSTTEITRVFLLLAAFCGVRAVLVVLNNFLLIRVVDKLCAVLGGVDFGLCHRDLLYRLINRSLS